MLIGLISDTHGLWRPEVAPAFAGVDLILHAGDIGALAVLDALKAIAPVIAVRGNCDLDPWARTIPLTATTRAADLVIHMLHDFNEVDKSAEAVRFDIIVSGHSHRPSIDHRDGVLCVNPGSAGPRRFSLPLTVARLRIEGRSASAHVIDLARTV